MSNYMMRNNPQQMPRGCKQQMPRRMEEECLMPHRTEEECRMPRRTEAECRMSFDTMSQMQLLNCINEVSFAVSDILLYLDTHPDDCAALSYSREMIAVRREAMAVYARRFAPLTIDSTNDMESCRWDWVMQPWPWEPMMKGGCR